MSNKSALQVGQSLLWRSKANESEKVVEGQMSNKSALQVSFVMKVKSQWKWRSCRR